MKSFKFAGVHTAWLTILAVTYCCSFVFKLADFGTARELEPGERFISLHGTEEYLYPGMYERALINPQKKAQFSAKVGRVNGV